MAVALFVVGVLLLLIVLSSVIWTIIKFIGRCILLIFELLTSAIELPRLMATGYWEDRKKKDRVAADKKRLEISERMNKIKEDEYNKELNAVMTMGEQLRIKYPLADKQLIDDFILNWSTRPINESKEIQETIKNQHNLRLQNKLNNVSTYTINQILKCNCISTELDLPISVKTYTNTVNGTTDYIVLLFNQITNNYLWYVTKEIIIAKSLTMKILKFIQTKESTNKEITNKEFNQLVDYTLLEQKLSN